MRCFIALPLPPGAGDALDAAVAAHRGNRSLAWTRPESYHLTLAFLGEIEGRSVERAASALDAVAGSGEIPFSFECFGSFPPRGRPRVLYARIADGGGSAGLQRLVEAALAEAAPRERRPFSAHITLARRYMGSPGSAAPALDLRSLDLRVPPGSWTLARCALYKSELTRGGSVYTELRGVNLSPR